ncbi:MAG: LpqB family beta-propeller domain-containing protein, partial [Actinomycetota bacterium]
AALPSRPETSGLVAFVSDAAANDDVYTLDLASGAVEQLTTNPSQDLSPSWSPDGRRLAYASSALEGHLQIAVMNADGTGSRPVSRCSRGACVSDGSPAWSPDGALIAFGRLHPDNRFSLLVVRPDGTGLRTLAGGPFAGGESSLAVASPAWSPDGTRLAFEREGKIHVIGADGSGEVELDGDAPGRDLAPAWSPDGRRIAFVSNRDGPFGIHVMDADGSGAVRLTAPAAAPPGAGDGSPSWSPKGTRLLFVRDDGSDRNVWIMAPDGGGQRQLTLSRSTEEEPAWAPAR